MRINFKEVVLYNFLSYHEARIELEGRNYCLVSGVNRHRADGAFSNGSGKSAIWSAVCFALTGETINEVRSDLQNKYIDEDESYVQLIFSVDDKEYDIKRIIAPRTDLKIIINGEDKSGKGIRESQALLEQYLPDITPRLLGSVIILGQGMPHKFSAHSPSKRKEMLEQLSKSDFMIEDIRSRIEKRSALLKDQLASNNVTIAKLSTEYAVKDESRATINARIEEYENTSYDEELDESSKKLLEMQNILKSVDERITNIEKEVADKESLIKQLTKDKYDELADDQSAYSEARERITIELQKAESSCKSLEKEIKKLKSIKDICPTCGRPFEGVVKPDTTRLEEELSTTKQSVNSFKESLLEKEAAHNNVTEEIKNEYEDKINKATDIKNNLDKEKDELINKGNEMTVLQKNLTLKIHELTYRKENLKTELDNLRRERDSLDEELKSLAEQMVVKEDIKVDLTEHISVIGKMNALAKRDFRGFLLLSIIQYIDKKAKEYCYDIFGTTALSITLDGNDIDITYLDKPYELLSGGERTRIDLILQFAIRDMMCQQLNFSSNILVLDEVTDFLDRKSAEAVFSCIAKRLGIIDSTFIISHHADELQIPYDTRIDIVKNADGISYIERST